jgi:hypothetical protein
MSSSDRIDHKIYGFIFLIAGLFGVVGTGVGMLKPLFFHQYDDNVKYIETSKEGERVVGRREVSGSQLNAEGLDNQSGSLGLGFVFSLGVTILGVAMAGLWPTRDISTNKSILNLSNNVGPPPK